jgi:hypothetical protein
METDGLVADKYETAALPLSYAGIRVRLYRISSSKVHLANIPSYNNSLKTQIGRASIKAWLTQFDKLQNWGINVVLHCPGN